MRQSLVSFAFCAAALLQAGTAQAATLNFDDYLSGPAGPDLVLDGAEVSVVSATGVIFVFNSTQYDAPVVPGGGFCAVIGDGSFGDRCTGSAEILFLAPIRDLSFTALFVGPGDAATVSLFAGDALLSSAEVTEDGPIDFAGVGGITRAVFTDRSTPGPDIPSGTGGPGIRVGTGIAYTAFEFAFDEVEPPPPPPMPVPVPPAGPLAASALLVLALLRRRRG